MIAVPLGTPLLRIAAIAREKTLERTSQLLKILPIKSCDLT